MINVVVTIEGTEKSKLLLKLLQDQPQNGSKPIILISVHSYLIRNNFEVFFVCVFVFFSNVKVHFVYVKKSNQRGQ